MRASGWCWRPSWAASATWKSWRTTPCRASARPGPAGAILMGSEQHTSPRPDIEIAWQAELRPIVEVAGELGIGEADLLPYGHDKAKVSLDFIRSLADRPDGRLILVAG